MGLTVQPLEFSPGRPPLAVNRTLRQIEPDQHVEFADLLTRIRDGQSFLVGGLRGCGKTSLLNQIAAHLQRSGIFPIGPVSLSGVARDFDYLARKIRDWVIEHPSEPSSSILLLFDDLDTVSSGDREPILTAVRNRYNRFTLGCAGNFFEDEMRDLYFEDIARYVLPPFNSREIEDFFTQIERHHRCDVDLSALREIHWWSNSIPYFVQALMLSVASHDVPRILTAEVIYQAAQKMPPALISYFAQPLRSLEGRERDDAQELLTMLNRNGACGVDWKYSLVRNLQRWGLVQRDAIDWMTWSTPLLARWFQQAGPGFVRVENLPWKTEPIEEIEKKASGLDQLRKLDDSLITPPELDTMAVILKTQTATDLVKSIIQGLDSPPTGKGEPSSVRLAQDTAIELYSALVVNLGSAPAPKKGAGKPVTVETLPFEKLPDEEPPSGSGGADDTRSKGWKRAKPPVRDTEIRPSGRYINLWFTRERSDEAQIVKTFALARDKEVYLRMNIGPFDARNLMKREAATEFVSEKVLTQAFPETAGKPVPLEATIFSRDFDVLEECRTQKFELVSGQPSKPLYFPVTPRRNNLSRLRLCVFYKNHLLQSLNVTVAVAKHTRTSPTAQMVSVEMTFSADFSNAARLPARNLWLGINQSADDTHSINIKSSEKALSRDLANKIETALTKARKALLDVSFNIKEEKGQKKKVYRFNSQNYPLADPQKYHERFRQDLTKLAVAGNLLYQAIFHFTPRVEDREKVKPIVDELKTTLHDEATIQISRLKRMEDIWPWALVYESPIDPKKVKDVCLAFRGNGGTPLPYNKGAQLCKHSRDDKTIVCPYSFWGFKHIIEQPTQPGGKLAFASDNLTLEIKVGTEPVFRMLLNNTLSKEEAPHVNYMKTLNFTALSSLAEISAALDPSSQPPPAEPHLMYFFCHGKSDDEQGPYLSVGADESLLPSELDLWNFHWPNSRGLVFINGCHTVDLDPAELTSIMQPFVAAGASGIIGTEISVTTGLAREFANEFFKRFLANDDNQQEKQVGQIIKDLRLNLLMKYNPLGLVYTPYCSADLHVTH